LKSVGIICEYNPFHRGHWKQIRYVKERFGEECAVICLMSGNFVQRGHPAVIDKSLRAKAAVECGADLVLELPVTYALSSAEGFAAGGVKILSELCDGLCFGTETGTAETLTETAGVLLSARFSEKLRLFLEKGMSFPAARSAALRELGMNASLLDSPNDILAVEYCKAILSQRADMKIIPIRREGSYHALEPDRENPSATAVRSMMDKGEEWQQFVPQDAAEIFAHAPIHILAAGERSVLARLRTMADEEFEALPYGSEGLWRKFMHACRTQSSLDKILTATKSKRYTRTRLDRMTMCAFLGIKAEMMDRDVPYVRTLAFNGRGRALLNRVKNTGLFKNAGEGCDDPYWELEKRCGDLYGLFCAGDSEAPGREAERRIYYKK